MCSTHSWAVGFQRVEGPYKDIVSDNPVTMKITKTPFEGLYIIEPKVHEDSRGFFFESFNAKSLNSAGVDFKIVQENHSFSRRNVIRGLHFQKPPHSQGKLVRVIRGVIRDVVVDLRSNQSTFGKTLSVELSATDRRQLLVPAGFAHGFSVISDEAEVVYGCDSFYSPENDGGILHNDPALGIDWGVHSQDAIVSNKDKSLLKFAQQTYGF